jgi:hypothetical protein
MMAAVAIGGVLVSLVLGLLRWAHDRPSVTHDDHS